MAKIDFEVAVAFGTQQAEGDYNDALDVVAGTLSDSETPGADGQTAGLVLGDPEQGVGKSGLSLTVGRSKRDKAFVGSSFTKPISDFLAAEVPTFTFAFPFCGNRISPGGAPTDADAIPIDGIDAILEGAFLVGTAWGAGVGHRYVYGSPNPMSALVYYNGNRLELLDCRCALSIDFTPKSIPICTATIEVGSIKDQSLAALPTLSYGEQQTVSAPTVVSVGNQWQDTRGFSTMVVGVAPVFETILDSNAATGEVKEASDRETTFAATLFADDTVDAGYEYSQIIAATAGALDQLSWQVGASMTTGNPALAVQIVAPTPELQAKALAALGTKAGYDVNLLARNAVANAEFEIIFR